MRPTTRTFSYGDAQAQAAGADERRRVRRGAGRTAGLDDAQPGRGGDWAHRPDHRLERYHPARQKDDRRLHQVLGGRETREPRIHLRAQDGGYAESGVQQDAYPRRGQECACGDRRSGSGNQAAEGSARQGHRRVWRSDVCERVDRPRPDRRIQHLREPGRDRARDADFQGPQGAALDRFDGVSERRGDQYVSAGELNITQPVGAQHAAPLHPGAYDLATTRRGRTLANRMAQHVARVLASPLKGVYSTHIDSAQQFDRHWHDTYGFGFLEHGAQEWFSGRGIVRGYPGEVITTNPGELHDGRPLGPPTRRWRILYVDVDVMRTLTASERGRAEITSPVIKDAMLFQILQRLFARLERWNSRTPHAQPVDSLAFEEALVASCLRLMARHGTTRWSDAPSRDLPQVRERLADDSARCPSLADLARLAERARISIRDGCTLAAAAAATGFADQSHMTRVFARQFGFTPGAWRRAARLQ